MQQVEPLSRELSLHKRHTGDIANWAAQAGKKAGSMAILKTIGIFVVTALAATAEAVPGVTITVTRRRTRSVASDDNRSYWPSAPRYSIATFWPSIWLGDHAIENARAWHSVNGGSPQSYHASAYYDRPSDNLFELFRFVEQNLKSFPYDTCVDYPS